MAAGWMRRIIGWFAIRERKQPATVSQATTDQEGEEVFSIVDVTKLCDISPTELLDLPVTAVLIEAIPPPPNSNYRVTLVGGQALVHDPDAGWMVVAAGGPQIGSER